MPSFSFPQKVELAEDLFSFSCKKLNWRKISSIKSSANSTFCKKANKSSIKSSTNSTFCEKAKNDGQEFAPVILMVSGGADSVALLHLAATSKLDINDGRGVAKIEHERLRILHINHMLRGIESDEDEAFVCELAKEYDIPCIVKRIDVAKISVKTSQNSIEGIAREERYRAAYELTEGDSSARILTAHTADDRAETFFINAIKGAGLSGLSSIPRVRGQIVRPLLGYTHEELKQILMQNSIEWREDSTNKDTAYLRNFVRHNIMPLAKEINKNLVQNLNSTCDILTDEDAFMNALALKALAIAKLTETDQSVSYDAVKLQTEDVAILRRIARILFLKFAPEVRIESKNVNDFISLIRRGYGSFTAPEKIDIRVKQHILSISKEQKSDIL